jgi:hypothetical protein
VSVMDPLAQQIEQFLQDASGLLAPPLTPGAKSAEALGLALQWRISQQMAELLQAAAALKIAAGGGQPNVPPTVLALNFNLDPARLNEFLMATPAVRGYMQGSANQFPTTVPANGSATILVPVPPGYVMTVVGDVSMVTSYVGAQVSAQLYVDGFSAIGPQGFLIGPSQQIPTGQYNYAQDSGIEVVLTNPSGTAVTVWFSAQLLAISKSFYLRFIAPLLNAAYQAASTAYGLKLA